MYVGGAGANHPDAGPWNGGGDGFADRDDAGNVVSEGNGRPGGGATDFRLMSGAWNSSTSLNSRIMVAAGGGGATNYGISAVGGPTTTGGYGGGLIGGS